MPTTQPANSRFISLTFPNYGRGLSHYYIIERHTGRVFLVWARDSVDATDAINVDAAVYGSYYGQDLSFWQANA